MRALPASLPPAHSPLSAATWLLLEARDRVGGRVWTQQHHATATAIELGAEFVHGHAARVQQLARTHGQLICDITGEHWRAQRGSITRQPDFWRSVGKVMALFQKRFWLEHDPRLQRLAFLHTPHAPFNIWWTAYPLLAPVIVGWSGGPPARALAAGGTADDTADHTADDTADNTADHTADDTVDSIAGRATRTLAAELGITRRRMNALLEASFTHDWDADPCARGAYSYVAVGGSGAPRALARPVEDTLYFAGEATAEENGTVEGALASGERAARQVLRILG